MKAFLNALYEYALEQGIAPYLETREYRQAICNLEADWSAFRSALPDGPEAEPGSPPGPGEAGWMPGG